MPTSIVISSDDARSRALLAVSQAPQGAFVTIKEDGEKRRDRQNRFAFEVYNQVSKILGDRTPSDIRAESKLCVGVPILRANSDDFRERYDRIVRPLPPENKLELMTEPIELPVTSLMTVKVMAEYITQLLQYWDERGAPAMLERYDL